MGSYTPLDLDRFKQNTDTPISPVGVSNASSPTSVQVHKNPAIPYMIIASIVVAVLSGIFYMQMIFQNNLRMSEAESQTTAPSARKQLIIGYDATFPPMEYQDENNNIVGYGPEMGELIGQELNMEAVHQHVVWDEIFTALEEGKIDMIISSVTITDERKLKYDFSDPYLNAGQVIVTQRSNTTINAPSDLNGKKVGVQQGTTNEEQARKLTDPSLVASYEDYIKAGEDLQNDKIDAIIADVTAAKGLIDKHQQLKVASDPFTDEFYGIVFRKDEQELRMRVNEALKSLQQRGMLGNLKEKWLN